MRGLDESTEVLLRTGQKAQEQVRHAWDGFINFAARDNVLEVALGLMLVLPLTRRPNTSNSEIAY
jgi:large conductance mechanosensitive channel